MSATRVTRRAALVAASAGAAGLVAPAGARAEALSATDGSRLTVLLRAEADALYAYTRGGAADHGAQVLLQRTREHVAVLTTQLAAYGLGPFEATTSAAGLGPRTAAVASSAGRAAFLGRATALEDELGDRCEAAVGHLSQPDTLMTIASLLAAHAQLRVWLGELAVT